MTQKNDSDSGAAKTFDPRLLAALAVTAIIIIAAVLFLQQVPGRLPAPPVTPAPVPDTISPTPIALPTIAPPSDLPPAPSALHIVEIADKPSNLVSGGYLQFRVNGANWPSITHGTTTYSLNADDIIRLVIGSDTRGKIDATSTQITRFSFDDVQLFINGDDKGSAPLNSISVNGYDKLESTLILDTPASPAWTRYEVNSVPVIPRVTNASHVQLFNIRPAGEIMSLDNIVNTKYDGGADAFLISPASVAPVANFTGIPASGVRPLTVQFTDTSTNAPTSWLWDFGDSNVTGNNLQNPSHLYQNAGTYTVLLTVKNPAGSNTVTRTGYITANTVTPPVAGFTAAPTSGAQPLVVQFVDTSVNKPSSWLWDFGDGNTTGNMLQNPSHMYTGAGTYTITLTAANAGGSSLMTRTNYVRTGAVILPVAGFTGIPRTGASGLIVEFTDISTYNPTSWLWSFGDDSTSTEQNPSHQYTSPGTYMVALTATNGGGSTTSTQADYITVTVPPPYARFTGSPISGVMPLTVSFKDDSNNTPISWVWDFGDGGTSTQKNPMHQYTTEGSFPVTLTATNAGGSSTVTRSNYIVVNAVTPTAGFTASPTSGTVPLTVAFTDTSTYYPTSWLWDFGDGGTSTQKNPSHQYTTAGTFTVTLTVTNVAGSSSSTMTNYITASSR